MSKSSFVYRCYDKNDVLIYIGSTRDTKKRFYQHERESDWWNFVVNKAVDEYPFWSALVAEEALIEMFNPTFNAKGKNRGWSKAIAYMKEAGWVGDYFRSNGRAVYVTESA